MALVPFFTVSQHKSYFSSTMVLNGRVGRVGDYFAPQRTFVNIWRHFHNLRGAVGIYGAKTRDPAKPVQCT